MTRFVGILAPVLTALLASGCKDACEELSPRVEVRYSLSNTVSAGAVKGFRSSVVVGSASPRSRTLSLAEAGYDGASEGAFVLLLESGLAADPSLWIELQALGATGQRLASGSAGPTIMESNGCNFLTLALAPGAGPDRGADLLRDHGMDAGDSRSPDLRSPDFWPQPDRPAPDLAKPDQHSWPPDRGPVDAVPPDVPVDQQTVIKDLIPADLPAPDLKPAKLDQGPPPKPTCKACKAYGSVCQMQCSHGGSAHINCTKMSTKYICICTGKGCKGGIYCKVDIIANKVCDACLMATKSCLGCCPFCGNGKLESVIEPCDGALMGAASCKGEGFDGGTLGCKADCTLDTSGCHKCGDGVRSGSESCDGTDFGAKSCVTLGFGSGSLKCSTDCAKILTSGCITAGFKALPAGTFYMGSPTSEPCREGSEETWHKVTLTHPLEISIAETTSTQLKGLLGYLPPGATLSATLPASWLSWHDAAAYCTALSKKTGLTPCYSCNVSGSTTWCNTATPYSGSKIYSCPGYRLPTEAEWEYAARAGTTTAFYNGGITKSICTSCSKVDSLANKIAWYCANSGFGIHSVMARAPNAWGLFDMSGNVAEWCHDIYNNKLGSGAVTDPWGASSGGERVVRGGSNGSQARWIRSANRGRDKPSDRHHGRYGVRCVRTLK